MNLISLFVQFLALFQRHSSDAKFNVMLSISLLFIVELFNMAAGKRNEIGHIPMKG
ncbi:unnamed protein product [Haemonchus placei]|uniref:Immediate early response 3-interacting protein 1 n=1 Tax=Haemonchus placei TaxID=6290 RepID=A0A0N4VZW9_HAEPC|nr:unnamed protein product [Haemonchus placei]